MFPSVTKDQSLQEKIKEKNWDDRFLLQHGIPDYSPLKDKHTKSYQKLLIHTSAHKNQQNGLSSRKYKVTFFEKRVQLLCKIKEQNHSYLKTIKEYEDIMTQAKIPNFYIYYSMLPILACEDIPGYTFGEIRSIRQQTSPFHRISTSVRARQECLQRLHKTLIKTKEEEFLTKKTELHEQFAHLRLLTTNVIDEIKSWRDSLGQVEQRPTYFTQNNQNYLLKLLNDNNFIFTSQLAEGLNFGERNDPFVIVPLRRAEGKEASPYTQIISIDKDISYYQKYMEYLASEKAYQLKNSYEVTPHKPAKNLVQKVYATSNQKKKGKADISQEKQAEDGEFYNQIEKNRLRQERLKRNQERMNSIKSIYDTYTKKKAIKSKHHLHSERKIAETDNEDRKEKDLLRKNISKYPHQQDKLVLGVSDSEFDSLVRLKVDSQRKRVQKEQNQRTQSKAIFGSNNVITKAMSKSMTKLKKSEDEMIENLKDIRTSLKSKLQVIKQEKQPIDFNSKYIRRNNQDIIQELKSEIMGKLERETQEKQHLRKKKREQQEKALEEIKSKLKREMEEKFQQRKRQKLIEREELQKKLKEEEERLDNQRNLQLQLQIKLNKQRELRQLEKLRREAVEKEKKFKQQLQKEQSARREQQHTIERERRQKQKLLEQLKKKELKQQLEQQLRKELKHRQSFSNNKNLQMESLSELKKEKQAELSKEIEYLKHKEHAELTQLRKQNELRERMIKLKQDEEQLKRKQVQVLMKKVIQEDKEILQRQSDNKRLQLQQSMRSNVKEKLLEEYRSQKLAELQSIKQKRQGQLQQEVYRDKIKQKLERQMRIEAIERTKKEFEDREARKIEVRNKLDAVRDTYQNVLNIDRNRIEEDVKKDLIEKVIFDKQAERENAKIALRSQFQRELLASSIPQIYESRDTHILKTTDHYEGDPYLRSKMNTEIQKPTNDKAKQPEQKSLVKQIKGELTNEQLQVYSKQKSKIFEMREEPANKLPTRLPEQGEGFQLMKVQKNRQEEEGYEIKIIRKPQENKQEMEEYSKKKRKPPVQESEDSEDIQKERKRKEKEKKKKKPKKRVETDSQQQKPERKSKHKKNYHRQQEDSNEKVSPVKRKMDFKTSEDEKKKTPQVKNQLNRPKVQPIVHYDGQNKGKPDISKQSQIEPVTMKPIKQVQGSKFSISVEAIPQDQLDQYLATHFSRLPEEQLLIQPHNRETLYRKLIGELTFCLLLGEFQNKVIGMAFACHDRSRSDCRKFTIVHMGTYLSSDLKEYILSVTNYIYRKDPVDQIEFQYIFNENSQQQLSFSNDFNKWFDRYGNVYQKKGESENSFERKYVMKRQFNQKCEVVLGGVNKNTFRNIFSVYSGVIMSNSDLLSFKEELSVATHPENQVSYAIMIAELFRTYLTPDEAELLKNKVKEFAKLKELLILVVMLQKKKVKMDELKLSQHKNLIELNMKLMSQGKEIIRYAKDSGMDLNRLFYCELNHGFNLPFQFQTTSLPVQAKQNQIRQVSYFRLSPLPPFKLHIIKSSLYNAELNILPTENSKYKIFVMSASQYEEMKGGSHLDLFMYIRLFLKNVKSHSVAAWKYVWLPQMTDKGQWSVREFRSFLDKDIYCHDAINISYRQFLPGALIIEPEHRDLVITPPFIVGVMSMTLQQVTEGSPLYARYIDIDALRTLEIQQ